MGLALLIVYLVLTFVRPGEQVPSLAPWRTMEVASGLALAAAALALLAGRGPSFRAVQIPLVLALLAWAVLSVLASPGGLPTGLEGVLAFAKAGGTAFLLLVLNVDSMRRLRIVAATLCLGSLFAVGQGVLAYHWGIGASRFLLVTSGVGGPDSEWDQAEAEPAPEGADALAADAVVRIRGLGFINDPNDLASTLVAVLPLLLAFRRPRARLRNGLLVWAPAAAMVYGIYLTRSRGGAVALAGLLALASRARLGRTLTVFVAAAFIVALVGLGFTGGRSMGVDRSASDRIDAWSEGLQMLKASPVWGVGFGNFRLHHERVAHNSFVHCFSELGLVGYFLWLGLLVLTLDDARRLERGERRDDDGEEPATAEDEEDVRRWGRAVGLSLAGFLMGAFFLSRSYDVMLFMLVGLGAALADVARRQGVLSRTRDPFLWSLAIALLELASIVVFWLYMRLLR
jgi:hypothetical protein